MTQTKDPLFTLFGSTELERDIALMDRVKEKFGLKSDSELARMIGVHKSVLSEIRSCAKNVANGNTPEGKARTLTALQRLRAFNHLGYAWARDALMAAFPEAVREELRKNDNERTHANMVATSQPRRTKARTKAQTGATS
ncbi:hypothetical protein [Sulfuricystis multivorans]|uniref:hypothetical protein n=1 Tax=Sulfuricystis multivorans TaxID=2211108 RepID=UPI000F83CE55|nr:hypothetical protein [Sulfuricystis multivorans]